MVSTASSLTLTKIELIAILVATVFLFYFAWDICLCLCRGRKHKSRPRSRPLRQTRVLQTYVEQNPKVSAKILDETTNDKPPPYANFQPPSYEEAIANTNRPEIKYTF